MSLEIGFITSNVVKLAHFETISRRSGFKLFGFRKKTFYASYREPRLEDRELLLAESYKSALSQWNRAGLSENDFFFLEDTSVTIDALSTVREVPGVDIKYWMRETTFDDLDRELKSLGTNRKVTVRSDILLHIPPRIRELTHAPRPYVQFTGCSEGTIIDREIVFSTNPIYPWLDNKSFNKWFVPIGETIPFGMLSLEASRTHDFRKKAFDHMADYLRKLGYGRSEANLPTPIQEELPRLHARPPTFIICGPSCAGKTTLATHLVQNFGYMHFEASDFMRIVFYERLGFSSDVEIGEFAKSILKDQPWIVAEQILEHLEPFLSTPLVITGFRSPDELDYFVKHYPDPEIVQGIFVDAPFQVRYERSVKRHRSDSAASKRSMRAKDRQQNEMGLLAFKKRPDFKLMKNTLTKAAYYKNLKSLFTDSLPRPITRHHFMKSPPAALPPLEQVVIFTMGEQLKRNQYASSTEIAHLINSNNPRQFRTAKDNVSRYFNQSIHPYYDVDIVGRRKSFRLSQTGQAAFKHIKASPPSWGSRAAPTRRHENAQLKLPLGDFET